MKKVWLRWGWTQIEYFMFFPVILIISGLVLPTNYAIVFTFTLPLHTLAAIIISILIKKFKNIIILVVGIIYIAFVTRIWALFSTVTYEYMFLYILGSAFFFIWGIRRATGSGSMIFLYTGGLVIHGICLLIITRSELLKPLFYVALIVSVFYVIAALPISNRHYLITESQQKNSLSSMPRSVIRGNWIIIIGLFMIIGILSIVNYLVDAVKYVYKALDAFMMFIWGRVEEIIYFLSSRGSNEPMGEDALFIPDENPLAETISDIILALFLGLALYLITRFIIKNHKILIKNFTNFFLRIFNRFQKWGVIEKNYTDKQEFLLQTDGPNLRLTKKALKEKRWKDMKDNSSRTRFLYIKFVLSSIKKGYRFSNSDTPLETVERITRENQQGNENHELINETYNKVRYGNKEIGHETVSILRDKYL